MPDATFGGWPEAHLPSWSEAQYVTETLTIAHFVTCMLQQLERSMRRARHLISPLRLEGMCYELTWSCNSHPTGLEDKFSAGPHQS